MKDIAQKLNVSVPLVSKVLNNKLGSTGASEKTIKAIQETAQKMGYRPNRAATALTLGRQDTLAVIVQRHGAVGSGVSSAMLDGIAAAANRFNQRLEFALVHKEEFIPRLRQLSNAAVDAVIVGGVIQSDVVPTLLEIRQTGLPVLTIYGDPRHPDLTNIGCSEATIGQLAFEHLRSAGAQHIVYIDSIPGRTAGFLEAAGDGKTHILPSEAHYLGVSSGEQVVAMLLQQNIEFDAIAAQSDAQAFGVMRALIKAGKRIPQDVKVLGVDDSPACQIGLITLSSIGVNMKARGEKAVETALAMRDGNTVSDIEFPPVVFARESTGA